MSEKDYFHLETYFRSITLNKTDVMLLSSYKLIVKTDRMLCTFCTENQIKNVIITTF